MKKKKVPKKLQGVLWSVNVSRLDLEKDKHYIIHQILIYGGFKEIKWLFKTYLRKEIVNVFLEPYKNYPEKTFYFAKNYLLGLKNISLDNNDYVTSISGSVRPRTSGSL